MKMQCLWLGRLREKSKYTYIHAGNIDKPNISTHKSSTHKYTCFGLYHKEAARCCCECRRYCTPAGIAVAPAPVADLAAPPFPSTVSDVANERPRNSFALCVSRPSFVLCVSCGCATSCGTHAAGRSATATFSAVVAVEASYSSRIWCTPTSMDGDVDLRSRRNLFGWHSPRVEWNEFQRRTAFSVPLGGRRREIFNAAPPVDRLLPLVAATRLSPSLPAALCRPADDVGLFDLAPTADASPFDRLRRRLRPPADSAATVDSSCVSSPSLWLWNQRRAS